MSMYDEANPQSWYDPDGSILNQDTIKWERVGKYQPYPVRPFAQYASEQVSANSYILIRIALKFAI